MRPLTVSPSYVTTAHTLPFANDLKLAHYVKIPHRQSFWAHLVAVVVSPFVCTGVLNFQVTQNPNICDSNGKDRFTCPGVNTYFTAAVLFGSIGAKKAFSTGGQYTAPLSAFLIGFAIPSITYCAQKRIPRTHRFTNVQPVMFLNSSVH
ncbi:OPT oligopeptide transporter protein-domain-containing protein [Aspergillus oleicola]